MGLLLGFAVCGVLGFAFCGVDFKGTELQKFLSSDNVFVSGDMKGFIPANLSVHSSMFIFGSGFLGVTLALVLLASTLRREKAEVNRRSSTGGGVFGISFGSTKGVVAGPSLCRRWPEVFR
jgi:hypothetical protein